MTLHPALLADMLRDEVAAARVRLGSRIAGLELEGHNVICTLEGTNVGTAFLRLDARDYDAEPMAFAVVQPDGTVADRTRWPGQLFHSVHSVLGRPWACVQGTYEYHCWPAHTADRWDALRATLRLPHLLDHLVKRAGK